MQLTTFFTLAASVSLALAGCFTGGETWGNDIYNANNLMYNVVCKGLGNSVYNAGETKSWCYHLTDEKRVDFSIRNFQNKRDTLSYDNCILLLREIAGCEHGGRRAYTKFEFTSDPNRGRCAVRGPLPDNWPWPGA
ncbi:hypothetical protein QBC40DRAFT_169003 [Triangularia verruculosa]|uniref:Glycan binding protein Y3-like domain-containing protein n=1 Tax=Triangularia verruculosa TaxID=2587418 RepID=A0AAN7AXZ9_9PEZI|nr:hypothetical protein QBC40DRAFT_169003 [Triangularia verruculosa]